MVNFEEPDAGPRSQNGLGQRRNMQREPGSASLLSSISNLTNTIIGTGMLATPGAFRYTGLLLGIALICFCGFTSALGLYLLTRCASRVGGRKNSFFSLASHALPAGAWWFDLAIALKVRSCSLFHLSYPIYANPNPHPHPHPDLSPQINNTHQCYGVSISYLIICGQLMPQVIISFFKALNKDLHEIPDLLLDRSLWILILIILLSESRQPLLALLDTARQFGSRARLSISPTVPLCFLRRLDSLRHTSYLSLVAVFYLVVIVIYYSLSSNAKATLPPAGEIHLITVSHHTISIFPVFVFAFTCAQVRLRFGPDQTAFCHPFARDTDIAPQMFPQNMLPVYNELFSNTESRVNTVISASIGTGGVVYQIVGVLGYLAFGSNVGTNIIAMYPSTSLFVCFGRLSIIVLTLFSYPLQVGFRLQEPRCTDANPMCSTDQPPWCFSIRQVHPCRASLDKVLSRRSRDEASSSSARVALLDEAEPIQPYHDDDDQDDEQNVDRTNGNAAGNDDGHPQTQAASIRRNPSRRARPISTMSTRAIDNDEIPLGKW